MAKRVKKVSNKEELKGLPIYYSDSYNYMDIAIIIRDTFMESVDNPEALGGPLTIDDIDVAKLAEYIEGGFEPSAVDEFMKTKFGKGVIFGAYLEHLMFNDLRDEAEVLSDGVDI